jgi:hypothetical protein
MLENKESKFYAIYNGDSFEGFEMGKEMIRSSSNSQIEELTS